jgi:hypothetical protein
MFPFERPSLISSCGFGGARIARAMIFSASVGIACFGRGSAPMGLRILMGCLSLMSSS